MLNEGVLGLQEIVWPTITADRREVYLNKRLYRPRGDAALPPELSIEVSFMVAVPSFDIKVEASGPYIRTDERRKGTLPGGMQSMLMFAPELPTFRPENVGTTLDSWTVLARRRIDGDFGVGTGGWLTAGYDINNPPFPRPDPIPLPFKVTLTPPVDAPMVFDQPFPSELLDLPFHGAFPAPGAWKRALGLWRVTVEYIHETAVRPAIEIQAIHSIRELKVADIPTSLINTLAATVMKKISPTISYREGNIVVDTPTHFLGLLGVDTEHSLPSLITMIVDNVPSYTPILAVIESRARLLRRLQARAEELALLYEDDWLKFLNVLPLLGANIDRVAALPDDDAVFCIVLEGLFASGTIDLNFVGEAARIDNEMPQLALIFGKDFRLSEVISNMSVDLSPLLAKINAAAAVGGVLTTVALGLVLGPVGVGIGVGLTLAAGIALQNAVNDIDVDAILRDAIRKPEMADVIGRYTKGIFERLSATGAVAVECELVTRAADDGSDLLRVAYYDPTEGKPPRPLDLLKPDMTGGLDQGSLALTMEAPGGRLDRRAPTAVRYQRRTKKKVEEIQHVLGREKPGPLPADFIVQSPQSLATLDRHDCVVVVMMENRSYDHMFWELRTRFPRRGYERSPATFSNPAPPGFVGDFGVHRNVDIGIGNTLIFSFPPSSFHSLDPSHSFEHTMFQIGGGTPATNGSGDMKGFVRDFALKSDSPQIVMSYFGIDSLPIYRTLVDYYAVCDRWFAALPVGTQPNRLAALQGNVPFLHNIDMDDPSLGFLEDYSVFDLLNEQGISWRFFEGDIGTIRLYDRFRLDVRNVRPLSALENTLRTGRDTGQLPRAIFIEPEFLFGNDDHPPVDIRDGQDFIKHLVGQFIDFGLLNRVLFVITYDEHGGFFDHVAPPGTPQGDSAWVNNVANMFPQAPETAPNSMGVRVPSIVMSPFITAEAKHTVLDHTSILKTILLHNRAMLSTDQFTRFGDRVARGSHLGELMDLNVPRVIDYAALAASMGYESENSWFANRGSTIVDEDVAELNRTHPARVLQNISSPRARRFVSSA